MKNILTGLCLVLIGLSSSAQIVDKEKELREKYAKDTTEGWKIHGNLTILFNQAYFSNWASGGQQSVAITGMHTTKAFYKKGKNVWDNTIDLAYGAIIKDDGNGAIKTDDKIDIMSKYGRRAYKSWFYAGIVNFKTQFSEGKDYKGDTSKISNFMAPGFLTAAIGMDYKPSAELSVFVTPISARFTFVHDQELADKGIQGVTPAEYDDNGMKLKDGANLRKEMGGYLRVYFSKEIMKNIKFDSKLNLFSNYLDKPKNVDFELESALTLKVNDMISTNILAHLIYDDDVPIPVDRDGDGEYEGTGPRLQFKELLGIAITAKF